MIEIYQTQGHGRVNLIGEHTDYNKGFVLPTLIPQSTIVTLQKRNDKKVILKSSQGREFEYQLGKEARTQTWADYLQGATLFLSEKFSFNGLEANLESTIPEGSGLSSSASLEITFLKAIRAAYHLPITDVELALLGQRIENDFVGARVGIMDQMAVALANLGEALFLDTQNLEYERIKLPLDKCDLLVINSGIRHRLGANDGGYNQRRSECDEIIATLKIRSLRELDEPKLNQSQLPDTLFKRARHVITENERVKKAVRALRQEDFKALGSLFYESHESMKKDYEISIPEIDLLVELCQNEPKVFGARLTGGGFGGSIVAITEKDEAQRIGDEILLRYRQATGLDASVLVAGHHENRTM